MLVQATPLKGPELADLHLGYVMYVVCKHWRRGHSATKCEILIN